MCERERKKKLLKAAIKNKSYPISKTNAVELYIVDIEKISGS